VKVAILAGSLEDGVRIARSIQSLSGVDAHLVSCRVRNRNIMFRWGVESLRFVRGRSLMKRFRFLVRLAVRGRLRVLGESLEHPESLRRLKELNCDVALHAANVIYRQGAIDCFRLGILNAHIGILPEYRGRCVAEWSMLQGDATGITVFFIDTGIDTGSRIVLTEQVSLVGHRSLAEAKQFLFHQCARCYRKGLEVLMQPAPILKSNEVEKGHRYYPMSRLLSAVVEQLIGAQS